VQRSVNRNFFFQSEDAEDHKNGDAKRAAAMAMTASGYCRRRVDRRNGLSRRELKKAGFESGFLGIAKWLFGAAQAAFLMPKTRFSRPGTAKCRRIIYLALSSGILGRSPCSSPLIHVFTNVAGSYRFLCWRFSRKVAETAEAPILNLTTTHSTFIIDLRSNHCSFIEQVIIVFGE